MKHIALLFTLAAALGSAQAQDMRPGIASIAVITTEPEGRYGMDGDVLRVSKLKRNLVALDEQLAIGHVHLKRGQADVTPERLAEIRRIADEIGAQLMVEADGRMQPAGPQAAPGA
jgi:hypothetical protein